MQNEMGSAGPEMFLAPTAAFAMLNPFLVGTLRCSAQANEDFTAIANEWQAFVGRRLKEDLDLLQRLSNSRTPDQVMTAYGEFWRKAAEDYGKETSTMFELMNGAATKTVAAAQSATVKASTEMFPMRRAA